MVRRKTTRNVTKKAKNEKVEPTVEPTVESTVEEVVKTSNKITVKDRILNNQRKFGKEYFEKSKCDYKSFGKWQLDYGLMINHLFAIKNKNILDAGGAYGALGHAMSAIGGKVTVLDISKHVIDANLFPNITYQLAPIQSMKKIADDSIDFLHVSFVLNYVDVEDLERTFKEMCRVMKKGGIAFIILDCNKDGYSNSEILKHIENASLTDVMQDYVEKIDKLPTPLNYFQEYKWNAFIIKK